MNTPPLAPALGVKGEIAEVDVGEVQLGPALGVEVEADALAGEHLADLIVFAFVREVPARGDDLHFVIGRVDQGFVVLVEPAGARVALTRRPHGH